MKKTIIMDKTTQRELSNDFEKDLISGKLAPLLKHVKKNKNIFILEIRDDYINIYYRGGMVLRVTKLKDNYKFYWDKKYSISGDIPSIVKKNTVTNNIECEEWINDIHLLTECMDEWFVKHPKKEKFIQQEIVINKKLPNYIITDFEYQKGNTARFDLMGIKNNANNPMLSFIELKQGYNSLKTSKTKKGKQTSGLLKHLQDVVNEINSKNSSISDEIRQAEKLIEQKSRLGLINNKFKSKINKNKFEVLFVLSDYQTQGSTRFSVNLYNEVEKVKKYLITVPKNINFDVKIIFLKSKNNGDKTIVEDNSKIIDYIDFEKEMKKIYN